MVESAGTERSIIDQANKKENECSVLEATS